MITSPVSDVSKIVRVAATADQHRASSARRRQYPGSTCRASEADASTSNEDELEVLSEPGSKADDIGFTAQRCTMRDVPGSLAHSLADTLLSLGAQSAR